jgi:hypothetical protein
VQVVYSLRSILVCVALSSGACVSQASPKMLSESGGAFVARGVLDAAGVFGRGCPERSLSNARNVMECGSGAGGLSQGVEMANLGVSVARAALGVALWALSDQAAPAQPTSAVAYPSPLLDDSLDTNRATLGALGLQAQPRFAPCEEHSCRVSLDPRLVIHSHGP